MGKYDLTEQQGNLLLEIIGLGHRTQLDALFTAHPSANKTVFTVVSTDQRYSTEWPGAFTALDYLHHNGFIHRSYKHDEPPREEHFQLTKKGLDCAEWTKLPRLVRWAKDKWSVWGSDVRPAVIAVLFTVPMAIATTLVTEALKNGN